MNKKFVYQVGNNKKVMPFYVCHLYILCVLFYILGAEVVFLPLVFLWFAVFECVMKSLLKLFIVSLFIPQI